MVKSFNQKIGVITNIASNMISMKSVYKSDEPEYTELDKRIRMLRQFQGECIDATKGIIAKPMPKWWYNNRENEISSKDNDEMIAKKKYNQTIVADKKPYFMNYIYPQQMAKYQKYIKTINTKCLSLFRINLNALLQKSVKTDEEREFIEWYYKMHPVSDNNCVMNRLCHMVEKEFEGYLPSIIHNSDFDYTILKSGVEYKDNIKKQIIDIYKQ